MRNQKYKNTIISSFLRERKALSEEQQLDEAGKILAEIEKVELNDAWNNVSGRINQVKILHIVFRQFQRIAAILFLPVLLVSVWSLFVKIPQVRNTLVAYQEVTSPIGVRTKVDLPDGTKVWLNAESTIKFPVPFVGNNRDVDLQGEAFLEVTKNKEKPFIIHSDKAKVKVLGTSFNFRSYHDDKDIEVVLKEGSVVFESEYNNRFIAQVMQPNNRLVVNKQSGEMKITDVHVDKYIAWHQNKLVFNESSINELASKLERWYGVEVVILDDKLQAYHFTTTFENETLQQVIDLLELSSPIEIAYKKGAYNSQTKRMTRPQVIIAKR